MILFVDASNYLHFYLYSSKSSIHMLNLDFPQVALAFFFAGLFALHTGRKMCSKWLLSLLFFIFHMPIFSILAFALFFQFFNFKTWAATALQLSHWLHLVADILCLIVAFDSCIQVHSRWSVFNYSSFQVLGRWSVFNCRIGFIYSST